MKPALEIGADLSRFTVLRSTRPDEIEDQVARRLRPHRLAPRPREALDCTLQHVPLGRISLARLCYGGRVTVRSEPLRDCYILGIPLSGAALYRQGAHSEIATGRTLTILGADEPFTIDFDAHFDQLLVRMDARAVEKVAIASFGAVPAQPLEFAIRPGSPAWTCTVPVVQMLLANNQFLDNVWRSPHLAAHVEWLLISGLLRVPSRAPVPTEGQPASAGVRRAEEYIHEHVADVISVADIAAAAGMSSRSLFTMFKSERGITPMALVRSLRLERVHEELRQGRPDSTTVTEVALRWGFGHLGEFSRTYAQRFGELPSQTLRAAAFRQSAAPER